ncbi:hypothetical protein GR168_08550 [Gordonia sp. JH63]|uniref:restriction endonuclease subunit S n=1 Tax=Gordonia sp. JH63 TaxID=2698900 RepID=UPI00131F9DBB|nr:restriction endonuclease subunit S [Gordonia sp. JH63]QHD85428.1 hypothetical protein GR168_08550 [Gordonia sp. JH63]
MSDDDFAKWTRRVTPRENDLLFSYETRLGEAALMPPGVEACLGRRMALLRPDPGLIVPRYLLYLYLSPGFQHIIATHTIHGATVPRIGLATMPEWEVEIPSLDDQRAIAEVLGALDDKITANERTISLSAELSTSIWRSTTHKVEHELVALSSLARFVNGRAYTKNATGTGRVVIRIAELNSGIGRSTVYNDIEVPQDNIARPGDLLFAWSGSLTVARWHRPEAVVNQHIFKVIPVNGRPQWLVEHALREKLEEFRAVAADKATTMGHIQRRHLDEPVRIPHQDRIDSVGPQIEALSYQISSLHMENLALAHTRDKLLPLLMSGKVTVKDIEGDIEDVV